MAVSAMKGLEVLLLAVCLKSSYGNADSSASIASSIPAPPGVEDQQTRGFWDIFSPSSTDGSTRCGRSYPVDINSSYLVRPPFYGRIFTYPPLYTCSNEFLGTNGCTPVINCTEFNLAGASNCSGNDYLEVSNGLNSSQRFCGSSGPSSLSSGLSIMQVKFQSGMLSAMKTYSCEVKCAVGGSSTTTTISSPPSTPTTTNCTCGIPGPGTRVPGSVSRIVGGETAPNNFWKWQTAIVYSGRTSPFCGGALINDRHVLTAAHCVYNTGLLALPAIAEVVFNEYNTSTTSDGPTVRRTLSRATVHPLYNPSTQDYDVAVLEFSPPLNLSSTQAPSQTPVCLPPRGAHEIYSGQNGTVVGWGTTSEGGTQPSTLQQATIPIITNDQCNEAYKSVTSITPRMICAQYPNGGVDSCQGDSGGPFMLGGTSESKYTEIGVVSFGEGCARADRPGVYARVTDLNDWIRQTAWKGTWCQE